MTTAKRPRAGRLRLESLSDQPDARREIAGLIRLGAIRVRPMPGDPDRVRIMDAPSRAPG